MGDSVEKLDSQALSLLESAAKSAADLTKLWPLSEARHLDNDAKYAENLEVRAIRTIARIITDLDVTVPDAEFVYEGADEIPGRPQEIVDALLAAANAYDDMDLCYEPDYSEAQEELENNTNDVSAIFSKLESNLSNDVNAINGAADSLSVAGNWSVDSLQDAFRCAKQECDFCGLNSVESQKITAILSILKSLIEKTSNIYETLPIFLYINEVCECAGVPRMMFKDNQWRELVDRVKSCKASENGENGENSISTLLEIAAPLLEREWLKHKEDVLWDPEEAKKLAKEEDDRKSREALAAKFAHVEGNKESTQALD
ncbi:hypothetical protein [Gardnerella vaginalis]|uniref:Uncharacterized protein n=1 Tax=Gardnerella vaginalis JCP8108 TaxID=1261066 RepID=S4GFV2_GARVA|nr:hypothetical protein [Gardnerella vaginalis]EPI47166.1 hypothetical protein HMPREF1581_00900 [Gardnerella vaginalis JCP8108]